MLQTLGCGQYITFSYRLPLPNRTEKLVLKFLNPPDAIMPVTLDNIIPYKAPSLQHSQPKPIWRHPTGWDFVQSSNMVRIVSAMNISSSSNAGMTCEGNAEVISSADFADRRLDMTYTGRPMNVTTSPDGRIQSQNTSGKHAW